MDWRLHWLEADGDLSPWREAIANEIEAGYRAMTALLSATRIDILVQRRAGEVIPETGTTGMSLRASLFSITIDPDNPNFARSLESGELQRTAVHEAHHCLRMGGPGYGSTLGEALVSEGLAGRFVSHVFGAPPDRWECAVDDETLARHRPDPNELAALSYDHASWFFGSDGIRPRWLGYTLGYQIVGQWLASARNIEGDEWVNTQAATVLAASGLSLPPV